MKCVNILNNKRPRLNLCGTPDRLMQHKAVRFMISLHSDKYRLENSTTQERN